MPTYEYKCDACGHAFEKFQSMTAAPVRKCPACGKAKARRLISAGAGLIFKGGGFYITDYRSDSYKESAKKEGGSTETKPESKPADGAKAESKPAAASTESSPATTTTTPTPAPAKSSGGAKKSSK
jgi:putative FmdB family regulatory protein